MDKVIREEIIAKIKEKAGQPGIGICSLCRNNEFTLADGFVNLSVSPSAQSIQIGGQQLPSVALVCTTCGNTLVINLLVLGLGHLAAPKTVPDTKSSAAKSESQAPG